MAGLLIGVGAFALLAGAVMIGFGIPVNEFSFGNTLISSGTTAVVGGLIVIGLGMVMAQLQRIAETLGARTPIRSSQPFDRFETAAEPPAIPPPSRVAFPARPKSTFAGVPPMHEPEMASGDDRHFDLAQGEDRAHGEALAHGEDSAQGELPMDEPRVDTAVPTLRNPDETPVTVEDEVSLSPRHPMAAQPPAAGHDNHHGHDDHAELHDHDHDYDHNNDRDENVAPVPFGSSATAEMRHAPAVNTDWQSAPPPAFASVRQPTTYFDAMWPAESKKAKNDDYSEDKAEPTYDPAPHESVDEAYPADAGEPMPPRETEPRSVAILKSGVVDGMGYTLYVDGSIEAELPDGTLRFASIKELREHLEKNP